MYLDSNDLSVLSDWLNNEDDITIIQSTGPNQWQAFDEISINSSGRYCFYHKKSGPLPLIEKNSSDKHISIEDPMKGWILNRRSPYFGAGHPAIFWLNIHLENDPIIGLSSFEWIGNHYAISGSPAPDVAKKWWNRLRRWVKKQSGHIPRYGPINEGKNEIYAFKSALKKIESGTERAVNPVTPHSFGSQ